MLLSVTSPLEAVLWQVTHHPGTQDSVPSGLLQFVFPRSPQVSPGTQVSIDQSEREDEQLNGLRAECLGGDSNPDPLICCSTR